MQAPTDASHERAARRQACRSGLITVAGSIGGMIGTLVLAAKAGWPASPEARAWLTVGVMGLAAGGLAWGLASLGRARAGKFDALGWLVLVLQIPAWLALLVVVGMLSVALFGGYRGD